MPTPKRMFTAEQMADARYLYEQTTVPNEDIAAMLEISRGTLRDRVKEFGWRQRNPRGRSFSPAQLLRRAVTRKTSAASSALPPPPSLPGALPRDPAERLARAERLQALIERQMDVVESIVSNLEKPEKADGERAARTLASLNRSLKEMVRLETPPELTEPIDDTPVPRDLDELRRELSRKLEAIIAEQSAEAAGEL
jgi:hypothetical protein